MTGRELRILRALARGPLYEGALPIMLPGANNSAQIRAALRSLERQGYVERAPELGPLTWRITEAGLEIKEAMTP